jgi:hypothetical protein
VLHAGGLKASSDQRAAPRTVGQETDTAAKKVELASLRAQVLRPPLHTLTPQPERARVGDVAAGCRLLSSSSSSPPTKPPPHRCLQ